MLGLRPKPTCWLCHRVWLLMLRVNYFRAINAAFVVAWFPIRACTVHTPRCSCFSFWLLSPWAFSCSLRLFSVHLRRISPSPVLLNGWNHSGPWFTWFCQHLGLRQVRVKDRKRLAKEAPPSDLPFADWNRNIEFSKSKCLPLRVWCYKLKIQQLAYLTCCKACKIQSLFKKVQLSPVAQQAQIPS